MAFFRVLRRAVARRYLLAIKVRAADLLTCSKTSWEEGFGHYIARHHLDFVICDYRSSRILAAIELDDKSHAARSRMRRDAFLNEALSAAGIPLIRFRAQARYDAQTIAATIDPQLSDDVTGSESRSGSLALSKSSSGR